MLWAVVASMGFVLLVVPEPKQRPLIPIDGWETTTGFTSIPTPPGGPLSSDILGNRDTTYWRSWNPTSGSIPGRLTSKPFAPSNYISVPYVGYAGDPQTAIYLECTNSGRRMTVATADAHETWTEDIVRIPDSWCSSQIRLVAESHTTDDYIGAGTPFTASFTAWIRESLFTIVFIHAFLFSILALGGLAIAWPLNRWLGRDEYFPLLAFMGLTAAGCVAFFIFDRSSLLGEIWSWLVVSSGAFLLVSRQYRGELARLFGQFRIAWPVLCLFLLSLGYVTLLYAVDTGAGSYQATYRYAPASWSTDNQLAQMIAEQMVTGPHRSLLHVFGLSQWKVSDRPPALAGVFLLARPVFGVLLPFGENRHLTYYFYQIGGIIIMSCWVLPFWILCDKLGLNVRQSVLATALVAAAGFVVFNSTYIWPKMNSAALGLGAYLLFVGDPYSTRVKASLTSACVGAGMAGLAMLCHGGVVFGLIPLGLLLCRPRLWMGWKPTLASVVIFIGLLLPWTLWQHFVDPPGNALVKYALAGTFGFGESSVSVATTVTRAYSKLTFRGWVSSKVDGIETIFGRSPNVHNANLKNVGKEVTSKWRANDFYFIGPSLGVLNAGWLVGALLWLRRRIRPAAHVDAVLDRLKPLLFIGVAGVLVNVLLTWDFHVIHHNSYLSMLALVGAMATLLTLAPGRWKIALAALQFTYFLVVWVASPLATADRLNVSFFAGWLAVSGFMCYLGGLVILQENGVPAHAESQKLPHKSSLLV